MRSYTKPRLQDEKLKENHLSIEVLKKLKNADACLYETRLQAGRCAANAFLYNEKANSAISVYTQNQESVHSIVWLILGGVITGEKAWDLLEKSLSAEHCLKPFTPYMHHYVLEAMQVLGKREKLEECIKKIWGGMLERGAEVFPEVFVADDLEFSPYGDKLVNSACHAWSCTPCYFLRD